MRRRRYHQSLPWKEERTRARRNVPLLPPLVVHKVMRSHLARHVRVLVPQLGFRHLVPITSRQLAVLREWKRMERTLASYMSGPWKQRAFSFSANVSFGLRRREEDGVG